MRLNFSGSETVALTSHRTLVLGKLVLWAVNPQIGVGEGHVQQPTMMRRAGIRMGVALEEPAGHAHPRNGYDPGLLQRSDQAHQEPHDNLLLSGREAV